MGKKIDDTIFKLYDYLDGKLTADDRKLFEQVIKNSPALAKEVEEQRLLEDNFLKVGLEAPSPLFAQQVMSKIDTTPKGATQSIGNGIFLLIGVMVLSILATLLIQAGIFDANGTLTAPTNLGLLSSLVKQPLPSISIPINGKLIVYGIILLNMTIAFIILDRLVLRPYFEKRMQHS